MVTVPVRAAPLFAVAWKTTDPLPLPLAPVVIESQVSLVVAVQLQPAAVVTAMVLPVDAEAAMD